MKAFGGLGDAAQTQRDAHLSLGIPFIWIFVDSLIILTQVDAGLIATTVIMATINLNPTVSLSRHSVTSSLCHHLGSRYCPHLLGEECENQRG